MSTDHRYVCILAGGAGTRLWPKSRKDKPKQFQRFTGKETPFQHMVRLASTVVPGERILVLTVAAYAGFVREQAPELPIENILIEPELRDNGPAVSLAMASVEQRDSKAVVAILWSDHLIQKEQAFTPMLSASFAAAEKYPNHLVTVGAKPNSPDPTLGYIQMGRELSELEEQPVFTVRRFIEKPDVATARGFVNSWEYLWNVGYKVMSVASYFEHLDRVQPDHARAFADLREAIRAQRGLSKAYAELPKLSIEHLFTQHLSDILVIPADMGWSDIGTWNALHEVLQENDSLVIDGPVTAVASTNSLVLAEGDRPVTLLGVENLIVVDTGDALLIMQKNASDGMKDLITTIRETNPDLL